MTAETESLIELCGFVAFFTLANLHAGGRAWRKPLRKYLPGRGIYYAGLAAMVLGWLLYGGWGLLAGASFTGWRLPGWYGALDAGQDPLANPGQGKVFGIDVRPLRLRDFIVMSLRGFLAFPLFVALAWTTQSAVPLVTLAVAALCQGAVYDIAHIHLQRRNGFAEAFAGGVWGFAYFTMIAGAGP